MLELCQNCAGTGRTLEPARAGYTCMWCGGSGRIEVEPLEARLIRMGHGDTAERLEREYLVAWTHWDRRDDVPFRGWVCVGEEAYFACRREGERLGYGITTTYHPGLPYEPWPAPGCLRCGAELNPDDTHICRPLMAEKRTA